MYTYFSRRRTLLFKGLLLLATVWLTVAVLVLMENREKVEREPPSRRQALLYDPSADEAAPEAGVDGAPAEELNRVEPAAEEARLPEPVAQFNVEDPLELVMDDGKNHGDQGDELVAKKGVKLYGELGKPVELPSNLPADTKKLVQEGWSKNAFNQYVSDLISVHRSLPDTRDQW